MVYQSILLSLVVVSRSLAASYPETEPPKKEANPGPIAIQYELVATRIVQATMAGNDAYRKMEELCDGIGNRLSGSKRLERAVHWAADRCKSDGQENVVLEPVMVPHWVRGRESAILTYPQRYNLPMLGLGRSVGTPPEGITAPVISVADKEELDALGDGVRGAIVLFNYPMPPYDPEKGAGYGDTVRYRTNGARWAAKHGAVACLVRSVTATSLRSPHTGAMSYGDARVKIPAAAITVEDAEMLTRLNRRGIRPIVTLKMEAQQLEDNESHNVIAELRGREKPEEIVVIGGHIDSWDVGQGAHDDGAGCVMAMEAINVLRKLDLIPRRTIRVVLWTNEENGLAGGRAYAKRHAAELANHVAAIESDSGAFAPRGYSVDCADEHRQAIAAEQMKDILGLLSSFDSLEATMGGSGADVSPMKESDVLLMGHRVEGSTYFNYHHTHADTLDKVDPHWLSANVAVLATVAYVLADMPMRVGEAASP
ncbi:MAG: M20/M25/M40 family metallo-hydrolase [Phycisphaerae bacterium]